MYLKIVAVGHLGAKPELRYTPSGTAVTNMSLATNRTWKDSNGEKQTSVTWLRVTAWGRMAETAVQYLDKGRQILVEGYFNPDENGNPRVWTRTDGTPAASYEITAREIKFLGSREGNGQAQDDQAFEEASGFETVTPAPEELQDEIPF